MNYNDINDWLIKGEPTLELKGQMFDRQIVVDILNDNYIRLANSKSFEEDLVRLINERKNMNSLYDEIKL